MAKLGEVCLVQSGGTPSRSKQEYWNNGIIPWVKISDIKSKYLNETEEFITEEGINNSSAKIFPKGTLLYTIFATLGEVCVLNIDASTNQAIAGIQIVDEKIDSDYLYYFLCSLKNQVNQIGRGVAQNNINMSILRNIEVPIPDKETQQMRSAVLSLIDKQLRMRNKQLQLLDELVKSRFVEMFGDPVYNHKGWKTQSLESICKTIVDCPHSTPRYTDEDTGYMCIRTSIVKKNVILWDKIEYISEEEYLNRIKRKKPEKGDIIYTREGAILGIAAIIDRECNVALGQRSMLLSPDTNKCISRFLSSAMNFDTFFNKVTEGVSGSASPHINVGSIKKFEIILPPLDLQNQFADFVAQVDKSKLAVQKSLEQLEILKKSLMQAYFG